LDAGTTGPAHGRLGKTLALQVEIRSGLTALAEARTAVWSGTAVHYRARCTLNQAIFMNSTHVLS
jgi:hypothetical protein